eukprot:TRINITY_DN122931_c0_g1_i1.p1 TRINITY_DN122931_c0_g1~~TRINITY_DN122931_c0_g1_i1.p1  ORF type:complete len:267 (-),score=19.09 TRINITY_DN122931_c0_g1_i1:102-836(-)
MDSGLDIRRTPSPSVDAASSGKMILQSPSSPGSLLNKFSHVVWQRLCSAAQEDSRPIMAPWCGPSAGHKERKEYDADDAGSGVVYAANYERKRPRRKVALVAFMAWQTQRESHQTTKNIFAAKGVPVDLIFSSPASLKRWLLCNPCVANRGSHLVVLAAWRDAWPVTQFLQAAGGSSIVSDLVLLPGLPKARAEVSYINDLRIDLGSHCQLSLTHTFEDLAGKMEELLQRPLPRRRPQPTLHSL